MRALDARAGIAELVREIAQLARDRTPASAHAGLADARLLAPRGLFVDHEIERHVLRKQVGKEPACAFVRHRHLGRQRHAQSAIDARHSERRILDRLHQHTAPLGPLRHRLFLEEVTRQAIHFAHISCHAICFRIEVVRREMIAARQDQSLQITLLARHAMQRLHAAHDGEVRHQRIVGIDEQLGPLALDRHRLDRAAVARKAALLDDPAPFEECRRALVGDAVKRDRKLQLIRRDAQIGAGDRHTLGIARELELRRSRFQRREVDVAIAEDEDTSSGNTAMDTTRHLQDLVGAQVQLRQHVLAALDDRREARVVDHDRVEPLHVERALPRRRHREEIRLVLRAFEEGPQHANRLAAVIVRRIDPRRTHADVLGRLLHALACRYEDRDAALLLVDALQELVVEKFADVLPHDLHLRRLLGVECINLEDVRALEILSVERRIDRRRQPDEPAAHALAEREAQLQFRRRLVDLVHDQRVARQDVAVLEPAARNARGDDDDVPGRRLGRGFPLAIDHADAQVGRPKQLFGDRSDRERLARPRSGDDAEAAPRARELTHARAEVLLEICLDVESDGELDGLARRAGRCDDDHATRGWLSPDERFAVGGKVLVSYFAHGTRRSEIRARRRSGLLPVVAELLDEGQLDVIGLLALFDVVITKDNPAVRGLVVDGRLAVGGRRLLLRRHLVEPDTTHARRRAIRLRHSVRLLPGLRPGNSGDACCERDGG